MNHATVILATLDRHLTRETRLVLYGRAALALGFEPHPAEFDLTMDVDAVLPSVEMTSIEADGQFWSALEATNRELEPRGLYITHLFPDTEVILRADWLSFVEPIPVSFSRLRAGRLHALDLILSKMMRVDAADFHDIKFLISAAGLAGDSILAAIAAAKVPPIPEIEAAFAINGRKVRALLGGG